MLLEGFVDHVCACDDVLLGVCEWCVAGDLRVMVCGYRCEVGGVGVVWYVKCDGFF